jgi:hypothetical protein
MKLTGKNRSTRGKPCPSATLSTTNPTWTDLGSNPGLRGERPATNLLSHGTALNIYILIFTLILINAFSVRLVADFLKDLSFLPHAVSVFLCLSYVTVLSCRLLKINKPTNEVSSVLIVAIKDYII